MPRSAGITPTVSPMMPASVNPLSQMVPATGNIGTVGPSFRAHASDHDRRDGKPEDSAQQKQQNGFAQHEAHDVACREADRLEDGHLWNPLSHGLRHHVARQEYQSEEDRSHDRSDDQPDIRESA